MSRLQIALGKPPARKVVPIKAAPGVAITMVPNPIHAAVCAALGHYTYGRVFWIEAPA